MVFVASFLLVVLILSSLPLQLIDLKNLFTKLGLPISYWWGR